MQAAARFQASSRASAVKVQAFLPSRSLVGRALAPIAPRPVSTFTGSFAGSSLAPATPSRGGLVVMANAKKSIACTKEGTNLKRRRKSGFKARMATKSGQKVLKARRARGRHVLCPASERKSGGKK